MFDVFVWLDENSDVLVALSALTTIGLAAASIISDTVRSLFSRTIEGLFSFLPTVRRTSKLKKYVRRGPEDAPLWSFRRRGKLSRNGWPTVLTIMNFKGGVGKTTLSANLAASLVNKHGLRVWVVDLDYQGSLTYMSRSLSPFDGEIVRDRNIMGDILKANSSTQLANITPAPFYDGFDDAKIVTAAHQLAEIEENVLQRWLLHIEQPRGDVRSKFSSWINAIKSHQNMPDLIIMDAPPRLSLSVINALVASDFVMIPALPQPTSIEPISRLLARFERLRDDIKTKAQILGVVFNMAPSGFDPADQNDDNVKRVQHALTSYRPGSGELAPVIFSSTIPSAAAISEPGSSERLAYGDASPRSRKIKSRFDALSQELLEAIKERLPD